MLMMLIILFTLPHSVNRVNNVNRRESAEEIKNESLTLLNSPKHKATTPLYLRYVIS